MRARILMVILAALCSETVFTQSPAPSNPTNPSTQGPQRRSRTLRISGRIIPPPGTKVPEFSTVSISSQSGGVPTVEVARYGAFSFKDLIRGTYHLRVESPGFPVVDRTIELYNMSGDQTEYVLIHLEPPSADQANAGVPAVVSARELTISPEASKAMQKALEAGNKNKPEKAIEHLKKAVQLEPNFFEAYNNLAVQYLRLGRLDEAQEALDTSVSIEPTGAAYRNIGAILIQRGDYATAVRHLQRSLELDPNDTSSLKSMGEAYFGLGRFTDALAAFDQAAKTDTDATLDLARGYCHLQLGQRDTATQYFESFLAAEPHSPQGKQVAQIVRQLRSTAPPPKP